MLVAIALVGAIVGVANLANDNKDPQLTDAAKPATVLHVLESNIEIPFREIIDESEVIVIGRAIGTLGIVNTARDTRDLSKQIRITSG